MTDPWWYVDLEENIAVKTVRIYNRRDCCSNRLDNAEVYVVDKANVERKCGSVETVGSRSSIDV